MPPIITCKNCGTKMSIDEALLRQISEEASNNLAEAHQQELLQLEAKIIKETDSKARAKILAAKHKAAQKADEKNAEIIADLKRGYNEEKKNTKELRKQISALMTELRASNQARENAELEMQKKLLEAETQIRETAIKAAEEKHHLKQAELQKQLADTRKALDAANRKAMQGSQQNQGEVLELELESALRADFPFDDISAIKTGQRGADIKQVIQHNGMRSNGVLLWETKNGKWQPAWINKFKENIRDAKADIGVLVSQQIPADMGEMALLDKNVWVVKPLLAPVLAVALRNTIIQVDAANKMNAHKDKSMEVLYQFLVGPEFRHRIEAIVENYSTLQAEIEKEKRSAQLRWAKQEKSIRAVIDNTIGMYGDLQGITNQALPVIQSLQLDSGDEVTATASTE